MCSVTDVVYRCELSRLDARNRILAIKYVSLMTETCYQVIFDLNIVTENT